MRQNLWLTNCIKQVYRREEIDALEYDFHALHRIFGQESGRQMEMYLNMAYICGDQALRRNETLQDEIKRNVLIIGCCGLGFVIIVGVTVGLILRPKKRIEPRFSSSYLDDEIVMVPVNQQHSIEAEIPAKPATAPPLDDESSDDDISMYSTSTMSSAKPASIKPRDQHLPSYRTATRYVNSYPVNKDD